MRFFILYLFFLGFAATIYAQTDDTEGQVTSEEAVIFGDGIINRGVWASSSVGFGITNRQTNSLVIKDRTRMAFHIRGMATVGIGKKMKLGAGFERNGFYYRGSDSIKTYSNTVFINASYRIIDQKDFYVAIGGNLGIPTMGVVSQGAINRDDSTFVASFGGTSVNLFAQQVFRINSDVNFYTEAGYAFMTFPEFGRFSFRQTRKDAVTELSNPNDPNSAPMNMLWNLVYVRCGFAFKM